MWRRTLKSQALPLQVNSLHTKNGVKILRNSASSSRIRAVAAGKGPSSLRSTSRSASATRAGLMKRPFVVMGSNKIMNRSIQTVQHRLFLIPLPFCPFLDCNRESREQQSRFSLAPICRDYHQQGGAAPAAVAAHKPPVTYLKDYLPPPYLIDTVGLVFFLEEEQTTVQSTLKIRYTFQMKEF